MAVQVAGALQVAAQAVVQVVAEWVVRVQPVLLLEQAQELVVLVALRMEVLQQDQALVLERRAGVERAQERLARQAMEAVA